MKLYIGIFDNISRSVIFWSFIVLFCFSPLQKLHPFAGVPSDTSFIKKEYIIASLDNFPPVNFLEGDKLTGFGKDLSTAVLAAVGSKGKNIHSPYWDDVVSWLKDGKADFIQDVGYTKEREAYLDYSDPILEMPEVIFVRPDRFDINDFNSLKGKRVACVKDHISHLYIKNFLDINCVVVKTPAEALYFLVSGDVDAVVYPKQIMLYLSQRLMLSDQIKITGTPVRVLSWSFGVKKGNKELLNTLNKGLLRVKQNGLYGDIYNKWFGQALLNGYTPNEVRFFIIISIVSSIILAAAISLFFANRKLLKTKNELVNTVTQLNKAKNEIQISEEKYRVLFESAPVGIGVSYLDGTVVSANQTMLKMTGYSLAEMKCGNVKNLYKNSAERELLLEKLKKDGFAQNFEVELKRKDGTPYICSLTVTIFNKLNDGNNYILTIAQDITEQKNAEETLRKRDERFRRLVEKSWDIIVMLNEKSEVVFVTQSITRILGYSVKEYIGTNCFNYIHNDDLVNVKETLDKLVIHEHEVVELHYRAQHKNGSLRWLEALYTNMINDNSVNAIVANVRDITDRKITEEALQQSEQKFRATFEQAAVGIAHVNLEWKLLFVNQKFCAIFNHEKDSLLKMNFNDIINLKYHPDTKNYIQKILVGEIEKHTLEVRYLQESGSSVWINLTISSVRDDSGRQKYFVLIVEDISERKAAEEELKIKDKAIESSINAIIISSLQGELTYANRAFVKLAGFKSTKDVIGKNILSFWQSRENFSNVLDTLKEKGFWIGEQIAKSLDGNLHNIQLSAAIVSDNNNPICIMGWMLDITGKKLAEQELFESENRFRMVISNSPVIIFSIDTNGIFTLSEGRGLKTLGLKPRQVVGLSVFDVYKHNPQVISAIKRTYSGEVFKEITKEGNAIFEIWYSPIIDGNNKIIGIMGVATDITEREKAEDELRKSEERFQLAVRGTSDGIWDWNIFTGETYYSPRFKELLGFNDDEFKNVFKSFETFLHPEDHDTVMEAIKLHLEKHIRYDIEYRLLTKSEHYHWFRSRGQAEWNKDGAAYRMAGSITDISERKKTEKALKLSEKQYADAERIAHLGHWEWDLVDDKIVFSDELYRMLGLQPGEIELNLEKFTTMFVHPDDLKKVIYAATDGLDLYIKNGMDYRIIRKDGETRTIHSRGEVVELGNGHPAKMMGTIHDITEQKKSEKQIKNSLFEKEVLLKEIHHRVKNNLQIISSLLYLQAEKIVDTKSEEIFRESENRIKSMALVHEKLYQAESLANIDFSQYIRNLTGNLVASYDAASKITDVNIDTDKIALDIDKAIPCGLILNELISNIIKYAFPEGGMTNLKKHSNIITIKLKNYDEKNYMLLIKDNGVGFKEGTNLLELKSLGLKLVGGLVEQLNGEMGIKTAAGTEFKIIFPKRRY